MDPLEVPATWEALRQELGSGPARVLVIGATDVGKTTFCWWLAQQLSTTRPGTWLIDADVGQSRIGPPATVGCAYIASWAAPAEMAFFAGEVSPSRAVTDCLGAFSAALHAVAEAGAEALVVDTTGWISGPDAVALKLAKAKILGRAHIVLIERSHELRAFRRAWRGLSGLGVHALPPAKSIMPRSQAERRAFRESAFRSALDGAVECEIDLRESAVSGAADLAARLPHLAPGLLVGLNDSCGRLLSLGVLASLDPVAGRMTCLCRPAGVAAAEVRVGRLWMSLDGTHTPTAG